jgi:hypothetical protein
MPSVWSVIACRAARHSPAARWEVEDERRDAGIEQQLADRMVPDRLRQIIQVGERPPDDRAGSDAVDTDVAVAVVLDVRRKRTCLSACLRVERSVRR